MTNQAGTLLSYDEQVYLLYSRFRTNTIGIEDIVKNGSREELKKEVQVFLHEEYDVHDEDVVEEMVSLMKQEDLPYSIKEKELLSHDDQVYVLYARFRTNTVGIENILKEKNIEKAKKEIQEFLRVEHDIRDLKIVETILGLLFE